MVLYFYVDFNPPEIDFCVWYEWGSSLFFFFKKIYLLLAALGLRCCARVFSSCSEQGLLFIAVHGLLIAVASPVVEHGL